MALRNLIFAALIALASSFAVSMAGFVVPPVTLPATNYQKWAHYHWAWVKNSEGNSANVTALYQGYQENNIPLGAINIDSTWATQFNNFEVDTTRFPDFAGLVKELHDNNLKVILWATSMVNTENPDFDMAVSKSYLVKTAKGGKVVPIKWWHGKGGLVDYTNPEAVEWWHSLMNKVLDVGVDGFKCDGTDPYVAEYDLFGGAVGYDNNPIKVEDYSHMYYRDFLYHTRAVRSEGSNGDAGLIMSRPVDCLEDKLSKVCMPYSPRDVMFSGWTGDDDGTFEGMRDCLRKAVYSSWLNYANFGCDIGGYRDRGQDKNVFVRWAQLGAFLPLMENGGGGEHRPWKFDDETVNIYRKFTVQHHRLASYLHTMGANAMDSVSSAIHPVDDEVISVNGTAKHHRIFFPDPKTFSYRLGDDILVHPVSHDKKESAALAKDNGLSFDPSGDESVVHMIFPSQSEADSTVWLDWWVPNDMRRAHKAGDKSLRVVPFDSYAVYVREGSLMPLHATSVDISTPAVERVDDNAVVFHWFHPFAEQSTAKPSKAHPLVFSMRESVTTGNGLQARVYFTENQSSIVGEISSHSGLSGGFALVGVSLANGKDDVQIEAASTNKCESVYNKLDKTVTVRCLTLTGGLRITVNNVQSAEF